ncbi:BadF/BadG/BcrA/BcrD ATPase family protein [Aliiroseovarius crassostreae]|uniref:BadF/BadG/BcrA/BcrD ATPase family protein n=1 Tax=Aliiroseovarius crassostreae TaxID=154981 RepID=UPI00220BAE47|nr:BadF/BadG/BcrA/BcrD ATPase family protein [Aliiroseovarius crassostreae]UWQ00328.1 ATPase [Aliiroseovarius crassostreae]
MTSPSAPSAPCQTQPVIAVDGGGTKCRMVLDCGTTRHDVEGGSVNVNSDFEGAMAEIRRCLNLLSHRSGQTADQLAALPSYLGLAGIISPAQIPAIRAALPFAHAKIEDDQPAALKGVLGEEDGYLAHCGTGSFVASQISGRMRFIGGWGAVLGDPASAMWVGRTALNYSLDVVDGLRAPSDLASHFLDQFADPLGILRFAAGASPADFGQLARAVTRFAETGDALALAVMEAGADAIADRLIRMGWQQGQPLCLTGGIGPEFAAYLPDRMQQSLIAPKATPLEGALALAHLFAREGQP